MGVADDIRQVGIAMTRRVMHDAEGTLTEQPYGAAGQAIYSVNRGHLNRRLLDLAEAHASRAAALRPAVPAPRLAKPGAAAARHRHPAEHTENYTRLFGTDGAFSAVRGALQRTDRYDYSQDYLDYGYKELTIAAGPGGAWQLEKNALHIWPRGQYIMIALPNLDGSFNCHAVFSLRGAGELCRAANPGPGHANFSAACSPTPCP